MSLADHFTLYEADLKYQFNANISSPDPASAISPNVRLYSSCHSQSKQVQEETKFYGSSGAHDWGAAEILLG
jgi:hypothetical protein